MNLGIFNRVNLKDNTQNRGMYSEWTSLNPLLEHSDSDESRSVLQKFTSSASKEVTINIVRPLASNLGLTQPAEPCPLQTDREVQWCMEAICYGLSLPLSEHDTIKDCVNVYCEWLSGLLPNVKVCVPKPILDDPNLYARKIIKHFYYLFIPRTPEGIDTINKQAVLCHRVLRTLQQVAHESRILESTTWEALLLFLLAINNTLLAPPTVKDDVADQLCERVLSVLFEIWLLACANCFPSPPLWKTLRESCMNWRHRIALIEQWNRINLALTSKLLIFMYGPTFPELKIGEDDLIPPNMTNDCIAQSWYRFLNTIGNPVCLTKPEVISRTPTFLHFAISSGVVDPCHHSSLQVLPLIFLKAMKGLAGQVDAFLGIAQPVYWEAMVMGVGIDKNKDFSIQASTPSAHTPTPPAQRRIAKSFSVAPSSISKGIPKTSLIGLTSSRASTSIPNSVPSSGPSSTSSISSLNSLVYESKVKLAPGRPKCNSILHLFGEWLFQAAFIGTDLNSRSSSEINKRPNSIIMETKPDSLSEIPDLPLAITIDKYESGRAEALGTLCKIMCSKKTGEELLPVYLARFYLAIQHGLKVTTNHECGECMVAILMNSADLFRVDLDGIRSLLSPFIRALEIVLADKDIKLNPNVAKVELRRSSIHILLSILVLPLHFQNATIKPLINTGSERSTTFSELKPQLMNLIMNALYLETDPHNTHMLLGGLFLCVQDSAIFETIESITQPSTETSSNLLASVSDTASTVSAASSFDRHSHNSDSMGLPADLADVQIDSAHAMFVRATYLVCHRLISTWKTDLNVSLAALELLSGLARIHIKDSDALECKRAVKWLCDYIVHQCSRPPPSHSKDLHSTIVAAFHCCSIWLLEHPYLLKDKDCLATVLDVAELGISGTKSITKPGDPVKMKEEKELKPVSMRVRDAAENLLMLILEQVGYFPSECGPESISSLLDEVSLLQHCNSWLGDGNNQEKAVEKFRYFVTEGSVMLALLEEPLGNDQDPQPTVTILIRGPFGRHAWTMQLRHLPRHRSGTKYHGNNLGRPVVMSETPNRPEIKQKYFPDSVDRISQCKVDQSIPSLESVLLDDEANADITKLAGLLEKQCLAETNLASTLLQTVENVPPSVIHEFQTARLFLSHFGLLNLDNNNDSEQSTRNLIALDSSDSDFCKDLLALDNMSPRTCDTVHIFYVKSQQTTAQEIVNNATDLSGINPHFLEFIKSLGWPVDVDKHPGWTGHVLTSWKNIKNNNNNDTNNKSLIFDGQNQVLYWADACSEIAFVVPSQIKPIHNSGGSLEQSSFNANSLSSWNEKTFIEPLARDKRTLSLDLDQKSVPLRKPPLRCSLHPHTNTKIMVVWLESFEDHLNLPITDLVGCMSTGLETGSRSSDVLVIGLHLMASGLLRVHLQGPNSRVGLASPLVDGMVINQRSLGPLVRHTALNMSRRKRLDSENYQPPHLRRRLKVQEIVQKYKREMTLPELLTYLFSNI
ncbi:ral GTPase-activating protein subunit beta isoform X2 [Onthophagus taurus]|uniref:ral GTPase-activating protein subunit beta isoform X2 n=1 Tax=Onthophagus taurus TaxID=166361 RepID=UPI0039BEACA7